MRPEKVMGPHRVGPLYLGITNLGFILGPQETVYAKGVGICAR